MGGKGKEHRARDHPLRCRGWVVRVGSRGDIGRGVSGRVGWMGRRKEEEEVVGTG